MVKETKSGPLLMDALLASVVVLISSSTSKLTRENDKERISIAAAVLKKLCFI
jgi:hypothetical protein